MKPQDQNQNDKKPNYDFIVNQPGFEPDKNKPRRKLIIIIVLSCLLLIAVVIGVVLASNRNVKPQTTATTHKQTATEFIELMKYDNTYKKALELESSTMRKAGDEFSLFALGNIRYLIAFTTCKHVEESVQDGTNGTNTFACQQHDGVLITFEVKTVTENGKTFINSFGVRDDT